MSQTADVQALTPHGVESETVVLASASSSRRQLLAAAGVPVEIEAPRIDEENVKAALRAEGASAEQAAETLAELKAQRVSSRWPEALVVGADQMLECGGVWFDKPPDRAHAAGHLRALSGQEHRLVCAVCVVYRGARIWHHMDQARLVMRPLSDDFIDAYLESVGESVLSTVGAYRLESLGAQLFSRVDGDYFTILGLPLLPLLGFLRDRGVLVP
jgi:septum formation protein